MPETALVQTILLTEAIRISLDEAKNAAKNAQDTAQVELILTRIGELADQLGACAKTAECGEENPEGHIADAPHDARRSRHATWSKHEHHAGRT